MHTDACSKTYTHTHTQAVPPVSFSHQSFLRQLPHSQPPCFGAGPAHLGKQAGRTHYHACSQFCVGLPPRSLYPNMSPDMRGLSSSGKGGVAASQGLGAGLWAGSSARGRPRTTLLPAVAPPSRASGSTAASSLLNWLVERGGQSVKPGRCGIYN